MSKKCWSTSNWIQSQKRRAKKRVLRRRTLPKAFPKPKILRGTRIPRQVHFEKVLVPETFPTKPSDDDQRQREHTLRHARIHEQLASDARYAGGLGWCAFDYNTHSNFGAADRICYHGVMDIFRVPKPAAGFYKSQCDPTEEIVLEPAFTGRAAMNPSSSP